MSSDVSNDRIVRSMLVLLIALVVVVPLLMLLTMAVSGGWSTNDYDFGMMHSWAGGWGIMMIVPVGAVLILVLILLITVTDRPSQVVPTTLAFNPHISSSETPASDPVSVLNLRLARGEVSLQEYAKIRDELNRR